MPDDVKRNDLELYEPITNPDGPAMTWSVFSTSYLELGDQEKGDELFDRSFRPYVREPFKVESLCISSSFFVSLSIENPRSGLRYNPELVPSISSLELVDISKA